jgi:hypothetical protein
MVVMVMAATAVVVALEDRRGGKKVRGPYRGHRTIELKKTNEVVASKYEGRMSGRFASLMDERVERGGLSSTDERSNVEDERRGYAVEGRTSDEVARSTMNKGVH